MESLTCPRTPGAGRYSADGRLLTASCPLRHEWACGKRAAFRSVSPSLRGDVKITKWAPPSFNATSAGCDDRAVWLAPRRRYTYAPLASGWPIKCSKDHRSTILLRSLARQTD